MALSSAPSSDSAALSSDLSSVMLAGTPVVPDAHFRMNSISPPVVVEEAASCTASPCAAACVKNSQNAASLAPPQPPPISGTLDACGATKIDGAFLRPHEPLSP